MSALTAKQLIESNIILVSLPAIVAKLNELIEDPNSTAADIALTVAQDPILTARLLKIVNSPFYSFPSQIDTISMAVTVLGTRQLRDIIIGSVVIQRFKSEIGDDFDVDAFWCHSITTGIAAREIALQLELANSERYYVTGLLHDIGKMVLGILMPNETKQMAAILNDENASIEDAEQKIFGFTHEEVAYELLQFWHIPETIYEPIAHHHSLNSNDAYAKDTAIVHIANVIANNIQAPLSRDDDTILQHAALDALSIDMQAVEKVYSPVYQKMDELLKILYYDIAA